MAGVLGNLWRAVRELAGLEGPLARGRDWQPEGVVKIIVGLSNPGKQYAGTRHNVGFDAVDRLAAKLGWCAPGQFDDIARAKFEALCYDGVIDTSTGMEKVLLMKPQTFMNLSGGSAQQAMRFFNLQPVDVMVVLDEMALPAGKIRLRPDGSPGGHNGLKDMQKHLGTQAYPRLRIGVDQPPPKVQGKDWVLGKIGPDQKPRIDEALEKAAAALVTWVDGGIEKAMNQFN